MSGTNRRIHVWALSLAGGLTWGIGCAFLALWTMWTGHGAIMLNFMADCYPGYAASVAGALSGFLCGFCDMFIGLLIFGLLYNLFSCGCCCGKPAEPPEKTG